MERKITLSKFRNIGLEKPEKFIINNAIEKDKIGDLVILIGTNNSGKSNVLDAIAEFSTKKIDRRDVTTLSFEPEDRIPELSFEVNDDEYKGVCKLVYGKEPQYFVETKKNDLDQFSESDYDNALIDLIRVLRERGYETRHLEEIFDGTVISTKEHLNEIFNIFDEFYGGNNFIYGGNRRGNDFVSNICNGYSDNLIISSYKSKRHKDVLSDANQYFQTKYGIPFIPTIYRYVEERISNNDMLTTPQNLNNNSFFKAIFKAIGMNIEEINAAYAQFNEFHNKASLTKINNKINKNIGKLNDEFNKLYFADNDKYKFSIELDTNSIAFSMARGDDADPIMIEYQSTGFRWFFNLYFKFLCGEKLRIGDIVIMDEPATNLHPQGQIELRRFMKEFAIRNGITFIIATHSPFLIDTDYYDELRVVSMSNNKTNIENLFSAVNVDDPDSLLPIKESLTIKQNVLYDYDTQVVWVEGITDYNYLTLFKKLLDIKNIAFIPFKGVGGSDAEQTEIIKRLKGIKFPKKMILVDGDKAGLSFKKKCVGTCFESRVVTIGDLSTDSKKFKEIEDLFSISDKKKYSSLQEESDDFKKSKYTSIMKKTCNSDGFTTETKNNFKELFKLLTE